MAVVVCAGLDDVALHVKVWHATSPSRPPVVLLHATGETAEDWNEVAAALSRSRAAYAVNLRGHGPSDWPGTYSIDLLTADVMAVLDRLGLDRVDLVGHSLGGLVACRVAAALPGRVHRLVLEDVGLLHPRQPAPPDRPAGDLPFDWRVVEQVRPEIDHPGAGWAGVLAAVVAPTLVVSGGPSSPVPQEHVAELVGLVRDGRHVIVDAGHLVHTWMPAEFIRHLLDFLGD